jgi:hypothetical protein
VRLGIVVAGIAVRLAAARIKRVRERAVRTALAALADQARRRNPPHNTPPAADSARGTGNGTDGRPSNGERRMGPAAGITSGVDE